MRLRPILASFFTLAVLASGCQRPQPAVPEKTETEQASDDFDDYVAEIRNAEKPIIAAHRGQLSRLDDVLTLSRDGKDVATFTDSEEYHWQVTGAFVQTVDGQPQTFFLLECHVYANDGQRRTFIVGADGTPLDAVLDKAMVFDGPLIASGSGGSVDGRTTEIDDWSQTPHLMFAFHSPCDPVKWIDANTLAAKCGSEAYSGESDAVINRVSPTEWRLKETVTPEVEQREAAAQSRAAAIGTAAESQIAREYMRYEESAKGVRVDAFDAEGINDLTKYGYARVDPS